MAKQLFTGRTNNSSTDNLFINPFCYGTWRSTEALSTIHVAAATVFSKLSVKLASAPGAGTSYTYTLFKNGSATAVTCTISNTNTSAQDTTNSASFAAGDTISIKRTRTGAPAGVIHQISIQAEATSANDSVYGSQADTVGLDSTNTRHAGVFWSKNDFWAGTATDVQNIVAAAGNITKYYIKFTDNSPGVGKSYTFAIYKNGVKQDGSGGTVDTRLTVSDTNTTGNVSFTLPVSPGDYVWLEATPSGTPTSCKTNVGVAFSATTAGQSNICGFIQSTLSTGLTQYFNICGNTAIDSTEANVGFIGGQDVFQLSGFQIKLSAAPGLAASGKSYTFDGRLNAASPTNDLSVQILEVATTGSDTNPAHKVLISSASDIVNYRSVPANTPTAPGFTWYSAIIGAPSSGGGAGKGPGGSGKKSGGGGLNKLVPGGANVYNIGNPGLDIGSA